jgi:hypothetical protein
VSHPILGSVGDHRLPLVPFNAGDYALIPIITANSRYNNPSFGAISDSPVFADTSTKTLMVNLSNNSNQSWLTVNSLHFQGRSKDYLSRFVELISESFNSSSSLGPDTPSNLLLKH